MAAPVLSVGFATEETDASSVVRDLIALLSNNNVSDLDQIRAALALEHFGTNWGNDGLPVNPDVIPALVDCSQGGTMNELSSTCMRSLRAIGPTVIPALMPELSKTDPAYYVFSIYAEVLPAERIGELLPYYITACVRHAQSPSHGAEHIVDYILSAFRKHKSQDLKRTLRDYPTKNKFERVCIARATEAG